MMTAPWPLFTTRRHGRALLYVLVRKKKRTEKDGSHCQLCSLVRDFPKKGILLDEKGLTVVLESTKWQKEGTTTISHYFPFTIPQAQISFTQKGNEHLNGAKNDDLEKEWKEFTKKWD